jgi:hypothetical protein
MSVATNLICPACNNPVHSPWPGKKTGGLFLDGEGGWYQQILEVELICPETYEVVIGTKTVTGDRSHEPIADYEMRATGRFFYPLTAIPPLADVQE